jgi:hypothetical protein
MARVAELAVALALPSWAGLADRGGLAGTMHRTVLRLRRQHLVDAPAVEVGHLEAPAQDLHRLTRIGQVLQRSSGRAPATLFIGSAGA